MAEQLIVVNGLPGSGKTSLAEPLARELGCPLLSKDTINEALADAVDRPELGPSLGAIAMDALWAMAARVPGLVVADSWWFAPRDRELLARGLATAGARSSVEVWCDVPIALARARFAQRQRHHVHRDPGADWDRWAGAGPVALGPVVRVKTDGPVDVVRLAASLLHRPCSIP